MANENNLIDNNNRTPSERRENAKKAGIASGKARRQKKELREELEALFRLPMTKGKITDITSTKAFNEFVSKNKTVRMQLLSKMTVDALKGDKQAREQLLKLMLWAEENKVITDDKEETPADNSFINARNGKIRAIRLMISVRKTACVEISAVSLCLSR